MRTTRTLARVLIATSMLASVSLIGVHRTVVAAPQWAGGTVSLATWSSNPTEQAAQKKLVSAFESKYHIKVDFQVLNGDYNTLLKTRMTAGTAPDVFYINSDHVQDFIRTGSFKDLDFLRSVKSFGFNEFYKSLQSGFTYKKKTYAFAKDYSTLALWYNKAMFSAAGISKPPATWAQLKSDACKLTNKANKVYGIVLANDIARWLPFVQAAGGSLFNKNQTKVTINSSASRSALDFYAGLVKDGCAATPTTMGAGWNGEAFGRADAAMAIEGNWMTSYMIQTFPTISWNIAPLPRGPKGYGNLAFTAGYAMWARTPHLKQATTLMEFVAGKQGDAIWAHDAQYLPSRKDIKANSPHASVFVKAVKYSRDWFFPPGWIDRAGGPMNDDILKVMNGTMSSSDALADMQSKGNAALQSVP